MDLNLASLCSTLPTATGEVDQWIHLASDVYKLSGNYVDNPHAELITELDGCIGQLKGQIARVAASGDLGDSKRPADLLAMIRLLTERKHQLVVRMHRLGSEFKLNQYSKLALQMIDFTVPDYPEAIDNLLDLISSYITTIESLFTTTRLASDNEHSILSLLKKLKVKQNQLFKFKSKCEMSSTFSPSGLGAPQSHHGSTNTLNSRF